MNKSYVISCNNDYRLGLGDELFDVVSTMTPIINVDLLIKKEGKTLVSWRDDEICGVGWHIPGGIVRYKETFAERIIKTAENEIGCKVLFNPKPLEVNEIILEQKIRGHFISFLFECEIIGDFEVVEGKKEKGALHWYNKENDVQLVRGQKDIYTKYL